jgi:RNA polymerase sigma factor (TIGR02999 family)
MRHVLADHARKRKAEKRGGDAARVTLDEQHGQTPGGEYDLLDLTDALATMERSFERQTRVIELRYLAGLTVEEVAETLGVSPRTVKLDTRFGLTWLRREIGG